MLKIDSICSCWVSEIERLVLLLASVQRGKMEAEHGVSLCRQLGPLTRLACWRTGGPLYLLCTEKYQNTTWE